jgi:hypothetical protein
MDGYTREALRIESDTSLPGLRVVRVLEGLREQRGTPVAIQVDNGTEFTSRVVDQWAYQNQVALHFIERGKPTQNAFIESFNGKFRDECLNQNWFADLQHARKVIEDWRGGVVSRFLCKRPSFFSFFESCFVPVKKSVAGAGGMWESRLVCEISKELWKGWEARCWLSRLSIRSVISTALFTKFSRARRAQTATRAPPPACDPARVC